MRRAIIALGLVAAVVVPRPARSFERSIHQNLTSEVLAEWLEQSPLKFTSRQREKLAVCVGAVDGATPLDQGNHFDNEALEETSVNIMGWTSRVVACFDQKDATKYTDCGGPRVRDCSSIGVWQLAMAVHAIQDFYSHSNFVSMYAGQLTDAGAPYTLRDVYGVTLGEDLLEDPLKSGYAFPTSRNNDAFCSPANPGQLLPGPGPFYSKSGKRKLTTGYFKGREAKDCLTLGFDIVCDTCRPCTSSPALPPTPESGKCQHGFGLPEFQGCPTCLGECSGINKDRPPKAASPFSCIDFASWHQQVEFHNARVAAKEATRQYLGLLTDRLNLRGVCRLFGLEDADCKTTSPIYTAAFVAEGDYRLGTVDPVSAAFTPIATIPMFAVIGESGIDPVAGRYYGIGIPSEVQDNPRALFSVDLATGSVTISPTIRPSAPFANRVGLAVDPSNGTIYTAAFVAEGDYRLGTVDPVTAAFTPIATIPMFAVTGEGGIDPVAGRYYGIGIPSEVQDNPRALFSVDLATGSVTISPIIDPNAPFGNRVGLAVDPSNGTIYTVAFVAEGDYRLGTVDPVSAAFTPIATIPMFAVIGEGGVHTVAGRYYGIGIPSEVQDNPRALFSVDLATGNVTIGPPIDPNAAFGVRVGLAVLN